MSALSSGFKNLRPGTAGAAKPLRTEDDLSMRTVVLGSVLIIVFTFLFLQFKPVPGTYVGVLPNLAAALLVVVFGFLFVTVSSRIVGLIGSSANPMSGMAIATLMATCAVFLTQGWTAPAYGALAITIGGIVAIAAAERRRHLAGPQDRLSHRGYAPPAADCADDRRRCVNHSHRRDAQPHEHRAAKIPRGLAALGHQRDALRVAQQIDVKGLPDQIHVLGADKSSTTHSKSEYVVLNAIGSTELADGKYLYSPATKRIEVQWIQGIGSEKAAAPQARLMATVINGILTRKLAWGLVLMGVFLVIAVELLGIRSLSFAVGAYLSIGTTLAIFVGGVVRWLVDAAVKKAGGDAAEADSEISPGSLFASGLIAAGGIVGLLGVALKFYESVADKGDILNFPHTFLWHDGVSIVMFAALAFSLYYFARKPMKK